ncbi:MAG: GLUG motif-containing protein [Parvibaculum sp.]|nr:GLUG motif-containing protein [Parvibaculum sp.]
MGTILSQVVPYAAHAADAVPTGGQYVAGQGSIANAGSDLAITQDSVTGIIDWNAFSIGAGNKVSIDNGAGATLNRVTGSSFSQIDGLLSATGSAFLINGNGIVIGAGGRVVTGGSFVASTRDISNEDFLDGGTDRFQGASNGDVINNGSLRSSGGDVVLIGKSVRNSGSIDAPNGTAALAAGDNAVLRPATGDQRIAIATGSGDATNSGTIAAAAAELKAADGNVYALAGNNGGIVRVTGTQIIDGRVWLTSNTGNVGISGMVEATNADGSGGAVDASGAEIAVTGLVDTSATAPGKTGGDVTIIATGKTSFSGRIEAEGGAGGQGGFVETSGARLDIADEARVSTLSSGGTAGTWLIDPNDFIIARSGGDITGTALSANLAGGNVAISSNDGATSGNGDIFVNDAVSWSADTTLTLDAVRNIEFNTDVEATGTNAGLDLNYGGDYVLDGASITLSGANASLALNGNSYTLIYDLAGLQAIAAGAGLYALATDIDATASAAMNGGEGFAPIISFAGTLAGLGHAVDGLTINRPTTDYVGMFRSLAGDARDFTLANVDITGAENVGALAGQVSGFNSPPNIVSNVNSSGIVRGASQVGGLVGLLIGNTETDAIITDSHSSTTVTASGSNVGGLLGYLARGVVTRSSASGDVSAVSGAAVGGLVGFAFYSISHSYATGNVTGGSMTGGLVGDGEHVYQSYATGNVSGSDYPGGLAGRIRGTASEIYSTGTVTGATPSRRGGLVGLVQGGSVQYGYWDMQTSGMSYGIGVGAVAGITGLTTAELQGALPAGFDNAVWGTGAGLYPYFYRTYALLGGTPQSVSGIVYSDGGTTALADAQVGAASNGAYLGGARTGANGYYYILTAPGSVDATGALAWLDGEATEAAAFRDTATAAGVSGLDIYGSSLHLIASAPSLTDTIANLTTAIGAYVDSDFGFISTIAASLATSGAGGLYLDANDGYVLDGNFTSAGFLSLTSGGSFTLDGTNATMTASSQLSLNSDVVWADASTLRLVVSGLGGDILLDGSIEGMSGELELLALDTIATTANGTVDVGLFDLLLGTWSQIASALPSFSAVDFRVNASNAIFLRMLGGDGTSGSAYRITDVYGLQGIRSNSLASSYFVLANDIDASGTSAWNAGAGFNPIGGNGVVSFGGSFDGQDHTISGLSISRSGQDNVGLFGLTNSNSVIANVGLVGGHISGGNDVGALVGDNAGTIDNAWSTADVTGGITVGGLVGINTGLSIANSHATGDVSGTSRIGGLVGNNFGGAITDSYAEGDVDATAGEAGGLAGASGGTSSVARSHATGTVTGATERIGGLIGSSNASVTDSWATGDVTGSNSTGGLIGYSTGSIGGSYATGLVTGGAITGGLAGYSGALVEASYATGDVIASGDLAGGLVGSSIGSVAGSWATGDVTSSADNVGGLIGASSSGTVTGSHAGGNVEGDENVGGLIGNAAGTVSGSWATGQVTGVARTGGLVGMGGMSIDMSYATGAVFGGQQAGGLIGNSWGSIARSFATGAVTGLGDLTGGLAAYNSGTIANAYATGAVAGQSRVGGLVGQNAGNVIYVYSTGPVSDGIFGIGALVGENNGTLAAAYWDTDTSGQTGGIGFDSNAQSVTGLTTAEMQSAASFAGWDIASEGGSSAIWRIYEGYTAPLLRWLLTPLTVTADNVTITHGDAVPPLSVTYSDPLAVVPGTLVSTLPSDPDVGVYPYEIGGLHSDQFGYDVSYAGGTLTVNAVPPAPAYDPLDVIFNIYAAPTQPMTANFDPHNVTFTTVTNGFDGLPIIVDSAPAAEVGNVPQPGSLHERFKIDTGDLTSLLPLTLEGAAL